VNQSHSDEIELLKLCIFCSKAVHFLNSTFILFLVIDCESLGFMYMTFIVFRLQNLQKDGKELETQLFEVRGACR